MDYETIARQACDERAKRLGTRPWAQQSDCYRRTHVEYVRSILELANPVLLRIAELAGTICDIFEAHEWPEIEALPVVEELRRLLGRAK